MLTLSILDDSELRREFDKHADLADGNEALALSKGGRGIDIARTLARGTCFIHSHIHQYAHADSCFFRASPCNRSAR
jgi:hypothetical protein